MKKLFVLVVGIVFSVSTFSQQAEYPMFIPDVIETKTSEITFPFVTYEYNDFNQKNVQRFTLNASINFCSVGIGWSTISQKEYPGDFHIRYRYRSVDGTWSSWMETHGETGPKEAPTQLFWSHLITTDYFKLANEIEIDFGSSSSKIVNVRIDVSDISRLGEGHAKPTAVHPNKINPNIQRRAGGACPEPKYVIPRSGWWGNLPADEMHYPNATNTKTVSYNINTTHTYVHHGASSNSYTDGASVVRGYWNYHVNSKGWKDIGYNYVMDKFGNTYLARHNPDWPNQDCRGAHTGSSNPYSFATCFAGNFQSLDPTQVSLDSLAKLLAWKCDLRGMDPVGQGLIIGEMKDIISGHRDAPDASTACPGDSLYAKLPQVRLAVKSLMDACNQTPTVPVAFCVLQESSTQARIIIEEDTIIDEYLVYQSVDGLTFTGPTSYFSNNFVVSGLPSDQVTYFKLQASNAYGTSDYTEVLAAVPSVNNDNVLIVNGFDRDVAYNTYDFIRQHAAAIENYGYAFSSATNEAVLLGLVSLGNYEIVDYILGTESTVDETFSDNEQSLVESYLDNGGKLFVSGSEIAWDLDIQGTATDNSFYHNYLKATYVDDAPGGVSNTHYSVVDINGDIFENLGTVYFDDGTNGIYNVSWPDVLAANGGSTVNLEYATSAGQYGGVTFEGMFPSGTQTGKLVNLGVPFETFYPASVRNTIMSNVLDFFSDAITDAPTASNNVVYCDGDVIADVTATANSGGTLTWYSDPALTSQIGTGTTHTPTNSIGSTMYYVTETVAAVESEADSVQVTINAVPVADAGVSQTVCNGNSVTITATGGTSYYWDNGLGLGASHVITPSVTTVYTVTATSNGCSSTDQMTVTVYDVPNINTTAVTVTDSDCGLSNGSILGISVTGTGGLSYSWIDANTVVVGTSIDLTGMVAGVFTLSVSDDNCSSSTVGYSIDEQNPEVPVITGGGTYCEGDPIGTLTATVGAGTINWYTDAGLTNLVGTGATYTPSGLTMNTKFYAAETQGGCQSSADSEIIFINKKPVVDAGDDQDICIGYTTELTVVGGIDFLWSTGDTTATIDVSPSTDQNYGVTVTDGFGCSNNDNVTVFVHVTTTANAGSDVEICNGESTTLTASGGGTYVWSTGSTDSQIVVAPSSTTSYFVTVSDNGCSDTDGLVVTVHDVTATVSGGNEICNGEEVVLVASGGTNYSWSSGSNIASITVTPTTTTNYIVTVTDGNGCSDVTNMVVTVHDLPIVDVSGITITSTSCGGSDGAIEGIAASGSGSLSYNWNNGFNTIAITNIVSGTYRLTVQDDYCADEVGPFFVTATGAPTSPSVTDPGSYCQGEDIATLVASGSGGTITWYSDAGLTNIIQTGTSYDPVPNITVTSNLYVTEQQGSCESNATVVVVEVNSLPIADAGADKYLCNGNTVGIFATGGSSYLWSNGNVNQTNVVTPNATTSYTVTVTDINGCTDDDEVTVFVEESPVANFSVSNGFNIVPDYTEEFTNLSTNAISYTWNFDDGNTSNLVSPTHTYNATGIYNVSLTAHGNACADDIVTMSVTVSEPLPVVVADFSVTATEQCIDQSITFVNQSEDAINYEWYIDNVLVSTSTNLTHNFTANGNHVVELVAINGSVSDTSTLNYSVSLVDYPIADFSTMDTLVYLPNAMVNFTNNSLNGVAYSWQFGDGVSSLDMSPWHVYNASGVYSVSLTVSNVCGSDVLVKPDFITVQEELVAMASFNMSDSVVCVGDVVDFTNTSQNADTYSWFFSGGTPSVSNSFEPSTAFNFDGIFEVTLIANNANSSDTTVSTITVNSLPVADFEASDTLVFIGNATVGFVNNSDNATNYFWDFGDNQTSTQQTPWNQYQQVGVYDVMLIASNEGCGADTLTKLDYIHVEKISGLDDMEKQSTEIVAYPNPFTDNLSVSVGALVSEITGVRVLNSLGQLVIVDYSLTNNGKRTQITMDFDDVALKSGVYILSIALEQGEERIAVMKR